jgi:hypothetical protein
VYWDILELLDEYLPLLLSIERYHAARLATDTTVPHLLAVFPPLFYGLGELSLLADRVVGKQQLAQFCLPVELVLVLCAMGQLHALHAECQILQGGEGLTIASWPRMQHAELSWQSAEGFFRWAASYSCEVEASLEAADPITRAIWGFFEATTVHLGSLARLCATHRLSTHLSGVRSPPALVVEDAFELTVSWFWFSCVVGAYGDETGASRSTWFSVCTTSPDASSRGTIHAIRPKRKQVKGRRIGSLCCSELTSSGCQALVVSKRLRSSMASGLLPLRVERLSARCEPW